MHARRHQLAIVMIIGILGLVHGCGSDQGPSPSASISNAGSSKASSRLAVDDSSPLKPDEAPRVRSQAQAGFVKSAVDRSISAQVAVRAGLPSLEKLWTAADMTQTSYALAALGEANPEFLPRIGSARSGRVFGKIISSENLEILRVTDLPIADRAAQAFQYHEALSRIFAVYRSAFRGAGRGDSELVELMGAQLRLSAIVLSLNREYASGLRRNAPGRAERDQGTKTLQAGAATVIRGSLRTLSERAYYRSSERARLVTCLKMTLPALLPQLTPSLRSEILESVESLAKNSALEELQPGLGELRDRVQPVPKVASGC